MMDMALVGASVEALVGMITRGRDSLEATALAVSSDFPPPIPMMTSGEKPLASSDAFSISSFVISVLYKKLKKAPPASL